MKVLALISANRNSWHYIISDSVDALNELGHKVFAVPILTHKDSAYDIVRSIEEFKPDFIFTANNVGLCEEAFDSAKMPILSWITTEPQILKELSPTENFIPLVVRECYVDEAKKSGHEKVLTLPLATNPGVFKNVSLSSDDLKRYECEISFAGGCNFDIWYKKHKEGIDKFFTEKVIANLLERHSWSASYPIVDHLIETLREVGDIGNVDKGSLRGRLESEIKEELIALHWAAMSKFRKDVIKGISGFGGIRVYGDDGWRDIKGTSGVSVYPFIEDRLELVKLYNATKINLNLPTLSHLNLSTFNITSTGVFMLTNYIDSLLEFFDEEKEIICFRDLDDLGEKIGYYLLHPEEAKEIASNAQKRVLKEHTFVHRMREVIRIVEGI